MPWTDLALPFALTEAGFRLRPREAADEAFLERLYLSVRWEELAAAGWLVEQRAAFLRSQFRIQTAQYERHYDGAAFGVLEREDCAGGRLYLHRSERDIRVIDISLLPEWRNRGVGGLLLQAAIVEAGTSGKSVTLHVDSFNPARHLYERLGFEQKGAPHGPYLFMERRPDPPLRTS